jgi:peptide/nickel transport system permease protein
MLLPVLFLVSFATFMMTELLPGDPALAILGENATPAQIAVVRDQLGLDEPIATRYLHWAGDALRGDLGESITSNQSVTEAFKERLPVTLQLALMAQLIALLFAIPVGVWSAWRVGRVFDRASSTLNLAIIGLPPFILGIALVYGLSLKWQVFAAVRRIGREPAPRISAGDDACPRRVRRLLPDPSQRDDRDARPGLHPVGEGAWDVRATCPVA